MLSRIYLALNAALIGLIGLAYLYDPNLLLGRYDLEASSVGMDNMLRSTYGGVFVGAAGIFFLGFLHSERRRDALIFAAIFMAGLAVGRTASMLFVGAPSPALMPLFYYEAAAAVIAAVLVAQSRQAHP